VPTEESTFISQSLKELLANKGLVGPTDTKSAKGILSKASKTGLTDTTSLIKSMLGITDEAKKSTKASAKAADKAAKAVDKTTTATADKITKGIKGSVFQNNTFLGNRFGGNTAGPGSTGSGPRTPKTPKSGGTPTDTRPIYGPKLPSFVTPGVSKGVTFADLPKPRIAPTGSAGSAIASIFSGIGAAITGALGTTTGAVAGAVEKVESTVAATAAATEEAVKDLSKAPGIVGKGAEEIKKAAVKAGAVGSRAPPKKVTISYKEIKNFFDKAKVQIPKDFEFIRGIDKEIESTVKEKNAFFNALQKQFDKQAKNPFGTISRRNSRAIFKPLGKERALNKPTDPFFKIFRTLFTDQLNPKVNPNAARVAGQDNLVLRLLSQLANAESTSTVKTGSKSAIKRDTKAIKVAKEAMRATAAKVEASMYPPPGVEEIYGGPSKTRSQIEAIKNNLNSAKSKLSELENQVSDFGKLGAQAPQKLKKSIEMQKATVRRMERELRAAYNMFGVDGAGPAFATAIPASQATSDLLSFQNENFPGSSITQNQPSQVKDYNKNFIKATKNIGANSEFKKVKVLHDLLLEENVQKIMASTDKAVKADIERQAKGMLQRQNFGNKSANDPAVAKQLAKNRKTIISQMAARQLNMAPLNPLSIDYDPAREVALLKNKAVVEAVAKQYKDMGESGARFVSELTAMKKDITPAKLKLRQKAADAWRKVGLAITNADIAADYKAKQLVSTVQGITSILKRKTPVIPMGLPSMDPFQADPASRPGLRMPGIVRRNIAFVNKGAGAVVSGVKETYQTLIENTIANISKQLPVSLGAHKKMLIKDISNALLKTQPLGAGAASKKALQLLKMPVDPATLKRVESALSAITNTIVQDYNSAVSQGATYATMSGQKATRKAGANALTFFKGALNKFVQQGDDLSVALQAIVTDMIAAASVGINDLEQKGVLKAGNKAPKVKASLLGEDGLISRLQRSRGGEKGLLAPAKPFDSESKPIIEKPIKTKSDAVIESTTATKEETTATKALTKAEESKTVATAKSAEATTAGTVAEEVKTSTTTKETIASKTKAAKTLQSVTASTIDTKITEMLGAQKVKQLAAIDAQIAAMTAEQVSSEAGQAVIAQRNELTKKLNNLEKAKEKVISAQTHAENAGRKQTKNLSEAKADLAKKLETVKKETDKLARKTKALTESMKPTKPSKAKTVPSATPTPFYPTPTGEPISTDTTTGPSGARSRKVRMTPRGGGGAGAAAAAAGSGMGGVIKKLDEVAISFDKSLANFFKGPNFFQGPNIFQGKIISADKLKITMADRARDAARLAKARATLIPSDDPLVERAKARARFLEVKRRMEEKKGSPLSPERRERLARLTGYKLPTPYTPATPVGPIAAAMTAAVAKAKPAMSKITDLIKLGISKGFHAGSKLGMAAVTRFVALYALAFKSAAKSGVDAMSEVVAAIGKIFGKIVALKTATGALASSYRFLDGVSKKLGESLKKNLVESIFLMRMLGTAIKQDVGAAVAQLMASLANSKVIKIWSFLLFTGMNKFYKILKTTLVSMSLFSSHGTRMVAVSKSLEAVSKLRMAAGLSESIPMIQQLIIRMTSYLGIVRGARGAFQALTKTMASALAVGIKLNASLMLIAPIFLLISGLIMTMRTGLGNSAPAMKNFKEAWILIKEAIVKLSQPFMALINKFGNIGKAASGAEEASGALYNISRAVKSVATAFNNFARSTGLRFINNTMVPVLTRVINRFILLGRAIKGAFKNDGTAASNFKGFLLSLAYEVVSIMQKIFAFLAVVSASLGPVLAKMINAVAQATIDAFMFILNFGKEVALFFGSILVGVGSVTTALGGAGLPVLAVGAGLIAAAGAATLLEKNIGKVKVKVGEASTSIGIGMAQGMARGARYMEREFLGSIKNDIARKYGEEIGSDVNEALVKKVGDPADVKKSLDDVLGKAVKNPTAANAAGESLAKNIAKGIKDKLISLKEDFTSSFFSKADDQISKIVDKYKEAVDVQKEEALKALDTQIAAIEALADAEEELTAKMEYEQKRREMILAKSLDRENYLRERKIAKYEGRTEDVRSLDLSFRKSDKESTKDIQELDTDRTKTLQEKQRSIAIAVINREKEAMSKTFDEMQKQFDINIDKILNKGFSTKEEFSALLSEIAGAGKSFSSEINDVFTNTMNGLPSAIRQVSDPSIGMFSMTMAALVDQAKNSFGAEVGTANAESILGAAYFMAKGMPDAFKTAFSDGVISQSVTPFVSKVTGIFAGINVDAVWIEAGRSAIEAMINEMKRKLLGLKGTLYDQFKELFAGMTADYSNLFPELERLAKEIARIEAIRGNSDSGGGADGPEKPKPSVGGAAGKYFIDPKSGEHLARRPLSGITASLKPDEKESSFFGSMIDGAKKLAEALGPVKTAILGAVGVIAGFGVLKGIFGAIAFGFAKMGGAIETAKIAIYLLGSSTGAMVAGVIGIIVGVFIYMYLKFESFRNMVNDTFKKFFNFLKDGFNALKKPVIDFGFAIFDGIKSITISVFGPIVKAIGGIIAGVIWAFMGALAVIATVLDKIKKPVFGVIAFIINLATSVVKIITTIITTTFDTFYGVIGGTVKVIGGIFVVLFNIFKSVFGAILNFAKGPFDWLSVNVPKILDPISKVFEKIKDVASNVFNTIKDSVVNVLTIIKDKFDLFGIKFKTIGDVLLAPFGLLFKIVKDNFGKISDFVSNIFDKIDFGSVVDVITTPFKLVFEVIKKAFEPVVGVLSTIGTFIISLLVAPFKIFFDVMQKIIKNPVVDFFLRLVAMIGLLAAMLATWGVKIALETTWYLIKRVVGALVDLVDFIWGGVTTAFNFMKDLIIGAWDFIYEKVKTFVDWWHENVGSLWLLLVAGFVILYEGVRMLFDFLSGAFAKVWDVIKEAASRFFEAIKVYAEFAWGVLKTIGGWLGTVFTVIWDVVKKAASICWDAIKLYVETWWDIIKKVAGWLGTAFTVIWDVLKKAASLYWDYVKFAVNTWWGIIKKVAGWLGTVFTVVWDVIKTAASAVWDYLSNIVPRTWDNLKQIANWISTVFVAVWDGLKTAVGFVWDLIKKGWDFIGPILGSFVSIVKEALLDNWRFLRDVIITVWDAIQTGWEFISPILGVFVDIVGNVLSVAWDLLKQGINFVWEAITTGWGNIWPILEFFVDIIGNALSGAWDILKGVVNFVWDAIKKGWSFVGPILGFFADVIGIVLGGAWDLLKKSINFVWDAIKAGWGFVSPVFDKMYDILYNVIAWAIDFIKQRWENFVSNILWAKDKLVEIFKTIGGFITSAIGFAIEKIITVWNGLKTAFQAVWDFIKPIISFIGDAIKTVIGGAIDLIVAGIKLIPETFKTIVNAVSGLFNKLVGGLGDFGFPKTILGIPLPFGLGGKKVSDFITLPKLPQLYSGGKVGSYMSGGMAYMKGGMMYGAGGMTYGPAQQGIPAVLHGGEYVINHKAVQRIGTDVLDRMNSLRLSKPNLPTMPSVPSINMPNMRINNTAGTGGENYSTQNVNIYVDNFIGEPEWFNSMMKKYNTTVLPRNKKAAGLESRVINSYNGINRGL